MFDRAMGKLVDCVCNHFGQIRVHLQGRHKCIKQDATMEKKMSCISNTTT